MSEQDQPMPVNHGAVSATTTTVYEAGKGGLFGFIKGALAVPLVSGFVGGAAYFFTHLAGISAAFSGVAATAGTAAVAGGIVPALVATAAVGGAALGVAALCGVGAVALSVIFPPVGFWLMGVGSGIGTLLGTVTGGSRGLHKVNRERAAAEVLRAEVTMAQSGAPCQEPYHGYPTQGSRMNSAMSNVQLNGLQRDGVVSPEAALQRA
jgi:hypothetical protein